VKRVRWLERVPTDKIVLVAGNHDQSIEAQGLPDGLRCHYLQDARSLPREKLERNEARICIARTRDTVADEPEDL
jgi:hypothetical protein